MHSFREQCKEHGIFPEDEDAEEDTRNKKDFVL
jgi:hypothetical protein